MNSISMLTAVLATTALSASVALAEAKYVSGSYQLDPAHSKVGFGVTHLMISTVEGKFNQSEGQIDLDEKFEKSKVKASVDMASIDTGNGKRDEHLKSPDFFEIAKYPKMTFESTSITGTPESFKLVGNLTIKGITKKVVFDGTYRGSAADGYGNQKAAFEAKTKINRKDFKIVSGAPAVGEEVTIDLRIQAGRPLAKK